MGNLISSQFTLIKAVGFTLTGAVLLVVCLNISGMMQVRGAMRERELSIRQAIGASRSRLVQYLLAESLLLAGIGGTLASLVLFNIPSALSWMIGRPIPVQFKELLRVDLSMIAFCFGLCVLTSLVFGFLPATRFSRPVIISSLKDEAGGGSIRVGRVHRVTAALQIAIAVPLLVMGVICLDRVRATATSDLGFASDLLYAAPLRIDRSSHRQKKGSPCAFEGGSRDVRFIRGVAALGSSPIRSLQTDTMPVGSSSGRSGRFPTAARRVRRGDSKMPNLKP